MSQHRLCVQVLLEHMFQVSQDDTTGLCGPMVCCHLPFSFVVKLTFCFSSVMAFAQALQSKSDADEFKGGADAMRLHTVISELTTMKVCAIMQPPGLPIAKCCRLQFDAASRLIE